MVGRLDSLHAVMVYSGQTVRNSQRENIMSFIAKVTHSKLTDLDSSVEFDRAQDAWYHVMDCLEDDQDSIFDALDAGGKGVEVIVKDAAYVAYREAINTTLTKDWDKPGDVMVPVGTVQEGDGIVYAVIENVEASATPE